MARAGSCKEVHDALTEYSSAPGKYQLMLRQPAVLFASIPEILQLAAGRGSRLPGEDGEKLRESAAFFIRAALLFPGADHYAVLGLPQGEAAPDLKERYRLMMRLTHPDFVPVGGAWPADAAVRVNQAYEVLSSPVRKREYDEQLATARAQRPAAARSGSAHARPSARRRELPARWRNRAKLAWALAVGVPLVILLAPRSEPDNLVQRAAVPRAPQRAEDAGTPPASSRFPEAHLATERPSLTYGVTAAPVVAPPQPEPYAPPPAALAPALPTLPVTPPPADAMAASVPPAPVGRKAPTVNAALPSERTAAGASNAGPALAIAPLSPSPLASATPVPPSLPAVERPTASTPLLVAAVPSAPASVTLAPALPAPAVPVPSLSDAQPLLTEMLQILETGSGEQLLRLLDADARRDPAAQSLSRRYDQIARIGNPVRIFQVEFQSEPHEGKLLVTGRIRVHAGEPRIGSSGEKLLLRAEFAQRGGKTQLTGLSGGSD